MEAKATQGGQGNVKQKGSQPKRSDCDDKVPAISGKFRKFLHVPASSGKLRKFRQARQVPASSSRSGKFWKVTQVPTSSGKFCKFRQLKSLEKQGCFFEEAGSIEDPA